MNQSGPSKPKKPRVQQKFRMEYQEFAGIVKSKLGEHFACCTICHTDFSIDHGGRDDCRKHVSTKKHVQYVKLQTSKPLSAYFKSENDNEALKVIQAEVLFTQFIIDNNLPISTSDKAGPLFKLMFPDSKIAAKYGCGRTKTTAIIKTLSAETSKKIASDMCAPYSVATDGSNDDGKSQLYPVVVRYFDNKAGRVVNVLLSMPACQEASCTGENIFNVLNNELSQKQISWKNCVSFSCDNASVMTGIHKGVAAFIKKEQKDVYIQGCACHLIHIAARSAGKELPVCIEDFLIDIYFYLDKSSKRQKELTQIQNLFGLKPHKILKHVSTRWLSLSHCIGRLLEQWQALKAFFEAQPLPKKKTEKKHESENVKTAEKISQSDVKKKADKRQKETVKKTEHSDRTKTAEKQKTGDAKKPNKSTSKTETVIIIKHKTQDTKKPDKSTSTTKTVVEHKAQVTKKPDKSTSTKKPDKSTSTTKTVIKHKSEDAKKPDRSSSTKDTRNTTPDTHTQTEKSKTSEGSEKERNSNKSQVKTCKTDTESTRKRYVLTRLERILLAFHSALTMLYCLFLKSVLPVFDSVNIFLQNEAPCIHLLKRKLIGLLSELYVRYLNPDCISKAKTLVDVDFSSRKNQRRREETVIGFETRKYLQEMSETGEISVSDQDEFFKCVRNFYSAACSYIIKKFPLSDDVLTHAEVADISIRKSASFASVKYFVDRFPNVIVATDGENVSSYDELELEFHRYQVDPLSEEIVNAERIDIAWAKIGQVKNEEGSLKYENLCNVIKAVLVLPHSNADCERIFSSVRKNKTDFRPNLSVEVLSALMVQKCHSFAHPTLSYQPLPEETLKKVKSATYQSLKH